MGRMPRREAGYPAIMLAIAHETNLFILGAFLLRAKPLEAVAIPHILRPNERACNAKLPVRAAHILGAYQLKLWAEFPHVL
jgi:hypothetical protein